MLGRICLENAKVPNFLYFIQNGYYKQNSFRCKYREGSLSGRWRVNMILTKIIYFWLKELIKILNIWSISTPNFAFSLLPI